MRQYIYIEYLQMVYKSACYCDRAGQITKSRSSDRLIAALSLPLQAPQEVHDLNFLGEWHNPVFEQGSHDIRLYLVSLIITMGLHRAIWGIVTAKRGCLPPDTSDDLIKIYKLKKLLMPPI